MDEKEKNVQQEGKDQAPNAAKKDSFLGVSGKMIPGIVQVVKKAARKAPETETPKSEPAEAKGQEEQAAAETESKQRPVETVEQKGEASAASETTVGREDQAGAEMSRSGPSTQLSGAQVAPAPARADQVETRQTAKEEAALKAKEASQPHQSTVQSIRPVGVSVDEPLSLQDDRPVKRDEPLPLTRPERQAPLREETVLKHAAKAEASEAGQAKVRSDASAEKVLSSQDKAQLAQSSVPSRESQAMEKARTTGEAKKMPVAEPQRVHSSAVTGGENAGVSAGSTVAPRLNNQGHQGGTQSSARPHAPAESATVSKSGGKQPLQPVQSTRSSQSQAIRPVGVDAEQPVQERVIRDEPITGRTITDTGVRSYAQDHPVYRPQKGNYVGGNAQTPQFGQATRSKTMSPSYRSGSYHAGGNSRGLSAPHRGGQGSRPQNDFRGGGGDKDRDEAPRQTRSPRQQKPKTPAFDSAPELNKKSDARQGFAQRNSSKDKQRRDAQLEGRTARRPDLDPFMDDEMIARNARRRKAHMRSSQESVKAQVLTNVKLPSSMTVKELAEFLKKTSAEVIMKLMAYGIMATVNNEIDYDTAEIVAGEFGIQAEQLVEVSAEDILFDDSEDDVEKLVPRSPVVVVMGHVDHGKTSILDYIRNAHVAKGEAGGITQHIGAYMVHLNDRQITFLDTPGHEAFTAMRARGASVTDIAVLVVAADDGVMPQTEEAIHHARAAGTEIIVAINKMDKPGINLDRVKQELAKHGLMGEDWGGSTTIVPVSAKTGQGMDDLLEMILLTADMMELKADPTRQAKGTVIEARLDKSRGPIATILVQRGTLRQGDTVVVGSIVGKIRAMTSDRGKLIQQAGPSVPVEILGLPAVPEGGDLLYAVENEKLAHSFAERKAKEEHERQLKKGQGSLSLDNLFEKMKEGESKELNLIVKADVQGSVEAVTASLEKLSNDEVRVKVIHGAVGAVTDSDVRLAEVSNAIIIGFNVRPAASVSSLAEETKVDVRLYRVIYNAIEDVENAMKGMLAPTFKEFVLGHAEVRETYKVSGVGTIAGCYVTDGKINRNAAVRVVRDGIVIHEGRLASLKRFKDDAREVQHGFECGMSIDRFNDIKVGDTFEMFENREVERE